jgi:toxin YoeB
LPIVFNLERANQLSPLPDKDLADFCPLIEPYQVTKNRKDYLYWQSQDKKTLKRINLLIQDTLSNPFEGIGKPEPLRENLSGFWSRRIDEANRLVYVVDDHYLTIISCRYHYQD